MRVEVDVSGMAPGEALAYAVKKQIDKVIRVAGERDGRPQIEEILPDGARRQGSIDDVLGS